MNRTKTIFQLLVCCLAAFLIGCSASQDDTSQVDTDKAAMTEEEQIAYDLNEALVRLTYGDKTGLYELEFPYLREETNFDVYLKLRSIEFAQMDSLDHLEVNKFEYFDDDSVALSVAYVFNGISGEQTKLPDRLMIYRYNDGWVKPTASSLKKQMEFDDLVRQADSAAAAESAGQ
jgi:hypothetical protein